jgi:ribosomal protein L28
MCQPNQDNKSNKKDAAAYHVTHSWLSKQKRTVRVKISAKTMHVDAKGLLSRNTTVVVVVGGQSTRESSLFQLNHHDR